MDDCLLQFILPKPRRLKYFSNDASCSEQLHPAIQVFAQQREFQSIEYVTARVDSALKYHLGFHFLNVRAYIAKTKERKLRLFEHLNQDEKSIMAQWKDS